METIELGADFMDEFYKKHPEYKEDTTDWCECDGRPIEQSCPIFHEDNVTPMDNCVTKHHYHCGVCLGIEQIG